MCMWIFRMTSQNLESILTQDDYGETAEYEETTEPPIPLSSMFSAYEVESYIADHHPGQLSDVYRLTKVIETEMLILTPHEVKLHKSRVESSQLKELLSWHNLGSWSLVPRATAFNVIDSRWVIKWKLIDGKKEVKSRLCVRGFKDRQADSIFRSARVY